VYACGAVHAARAAPSSAHWKVVPALSAANVNEGFTLLVGLVGLAVRLTTGGTVSIVKVYGVTLTLPAGSVPRTLKV
jgi:hypothetical protein